MGTRQARPAPKRRVTVIAAATVAAAAVIGALAVPLVASAQVDLPDKSVEELLEFARESTVDAMSGTIEQSSQLGLPDLEGLMGDDGGSESDAASAAGLADALDLLTGSHTANVYVDGERARLQVLDRLAERNVYVDGEAGEVWFVDSETQTATRFAMTGDREAFLLEMESRADQARAEAEQRLDEAGEALPTPEQMLDEALSRLDDSTEVSVGTDGLVAGREVYELVLEPRTDDTLVGEVRFAIDGETGVALAASVTPRGTDQPAFRVAFTDVSFETPDASLLAFAPSDGISVVEEDVPYPTPEQIDLWMQRHEEGAPPVDGEAGHVVHGEGWSAVAELPAGDVSVFGEQVPGGTEGASVLQQLTRAVDGGRVLETALLTVLFTDDGRVLVGAVTADHLVDVAAGGA